MLPAMLSLNKYLAENGRHSLLRTYDQTPHSWYNNMSGKNFWEVLNSTPERIKQFSDGMSLFSAMQPVVAMFPFEESLLPGSSPDRVLAVDVGGGRGMAMLEIRKNCPRLQGELVLQDRPYVLDDIKPEDLPGVTKMPHDFFDEQPVKNAQIYYIRRVLHDWQDEDVVKILKAIVPAMGPDSRIIISDTTLPEPSTPTNAHAVWMDLMMMSIGGKERTKNDWQRLADMSGLRLVEIWQEPEKTGNLCVVEYVLPNIPVAAVTNGLSFGVNDKEMNTPTAEATTEDVVPIPAGDLDGTAGQREVDWDERTVVGDRGQSVEPGS